MRLHLNQDRLIHRGPTLPINVGCAIVAKHAPGDADPENESERSVM
jgi:hypothetical protein